MNDFDVECLYCGDTSIFSRFDAQLNNKPRCFRCGEKTLLKLKERLAEAQRGDVFGYQVDSSVAATLKTNDIFGYRFDPVRPVKESIDSTKEENVELEPVEEAKEISIFHDDDEPEWFYYSE